MSHAGFLNIQVGLKTQNKVWHNIALLWHLSQAAQQNDLLSELWADETMKKGLSKRSH